MVYTVKSSSDFDKQLAAAGDKLVVVDFYASWCGPCMDIDPKVRALSRKYNEKVMILKVNVDRLEEVANRYKVSSMPTFVFIKNKSKVSAFSGADEDKLERRVSKMIRAA